MTIDFDPQLKQRLVGAATMLLLAVLIVPTILDGPPSQRQDLIDRLAQAGHEKAQQGRSMPALPTSDYQLPPRPSQVRIDDNGVEKRLAVPATAVANKPPVAKPAIPKAVPSREIHRAADAAKKTPKQAAAAAPSIAAKEARKPQASSKSEAVGLEGGWWIQVASFTQAKNAQTAERELFKNGFTSLVQKRGSVYRVLIGPIPQRAQAEKVRQRIRKLTGYKGILRRGGS